jgi:hypothetical protein
MGVLAGRCERAPSVAHGVSVQAGKFARSRITRFGVALVAPVIAVLVVLASPALGDFSYSSEFGGPSTIGSASRVSHF